MNFFDMDVPRVEFAQLCTLPGLDQLNEAYIVSTDGTLYRFQEGQRLPISPYVHNADRGRPAHKVVLDGVKYSVARLVALAFIGKPPPNTVIYRKDGNTLNDSVDNLEYVTRSELALRNPKVQAMKNRDWSPKRRKVALEKDGDWQIFGSINGAASYINKTMGLRSKNTANLRSIAQTNTDRLNTKDSIPGVTGWRRLGGYKALFYDEINETSRLFIDKRTNNRQNG